jgi:predicted GNAT family acetyltransferase
LQIKKYEGNYDKAEFYSIMGKYFAEKKYKKEMPYLENSENHIWFVAFFEGEVIGFGSVTKLKRKTVLSHSYVEEDHRRQGVWNTINEKRLTHAQRIGKPIEVITKEPHLKEYWMEKGFSVYRTNGRYSYLRRIDNEN